MWGMGMVCFSKGFWGGRLDFWGSNKSTKKTIAQCTLKDKILIQEVDLKVDDEGDDENLKGFKSGVESFQCMCVKLICV